MSNAHAEQRKKSQKIKQLKHIKHIGKHRMMTNQRENTF